MLFFTTFYTPDLASKRYEMLLEKKLKAPQTLNWDHDQYLKLLNLKTHASKAAASFSQLNCLFNESSLVKDKALDQLEHKILKAVEAIIKDEGIALPKDYFTNSFSLIKSSMTEVHDLRKLTSICNLVTNSICSAFGLASICIAGFMICTGPIGMTFLGIGLALLATGMVLMAAYSLYVDGRYLANKQVEEIDTFIETLFTYNCEAQSLILDDLRLENSTSIEYV